MRTIFCLLLLVSTSFLSAQSKEVAVVQVKDTSNLVFEKVDVEASVDRQQWINHLTKNLEPVVVKAAKKGMKPGQYTVMVRFLVERDGSIQDVAALNDPGFGLAKAVEKVLRTSPKWIPGEQNGKKVRSYHTQPVTVVIQR